MNATTPRTRRIRRVVGHDVARAALASHVDRDAAAAALAATRSNLRRPLLSLPHILIVSCYNYIIPVYEYVRDIYGLYCRSTPNQPIGIRRYFGQEVFWFYRRCFGQEVFWT